MNPLQVGDDNRFKVWQRLYERSKKRNRPTLKVGDSVRVLLKQKSFDKKYKPQFSKQVFKVSSLRSRYVYVSGGAQRTKYLRAYVQKIGEVEDPIIEPDFEGTQEAQLKELAKLPTIPSDIKKSPQTLAKTKGKRSKKTITKGQTVFIPATTYGVQFAKNEFGKKYKTATYSGIVGDKEGKKWIVNFPDGTESVFSERDLLKYTKVT
jgi:hypothetical protein